MFYFRICHTIPLQSKYKSSYINDACWTRFLLLRHALARNFRCARVASCLVPILRRSPSIHERYDLDDSRDWLNSPTTSPPCQYTFKTIMAMHAEVQRLLVDSKACPVISSSTYVTWMTEQPAGCQMMDCDRDSVSFNFEEGKDTSYRNVFSRLLTLHEVSSLLQLVIYVLKYWFTVEQFRKYFVPI